ncbi:nitrogen fixation NifU-like protein [Natronocella acetinitrilica]|uniref:Nitrogen fixation NifU-like protein n=1 Tax=Natronocella acetinitrilica TaxID=414046 RepID=A0AAE3G3W9_9GAMM|nr:SUF system NifU family Fe-S cluster assembly protein [Natronocella acetinitrilica]MCP1674942.1 nitrogen fixation NifU-like protein [Natronocella acetinitrilica]
MTEQSPAALYQTVVIEHNRSPRNFRVVEPCSHAATGRNPVCGDTVILLLRVDDHGRIADVGFQGDSCAVTTASASLLTVNLLGQTVDDALELARSVEIMISQGDRVADSAPGRDDLNVLADVRHFPGRCNCARLPWMTLQTMLGEQADPVAKQSAAALQVTVDR